ncbi:DUF1641 domain-containing protein [Natrinema limicola]|uniref:DUF1641 domain-containing protein n=1 Tax=Natrinema limicola JCM 13563 TaxID=1230457 RepID=M0C4B8_9EURY|nr:DUF1641 domain-containing protein [Natrinema limicola]ELZ17493.1 hypothetical protein C476_16125 [Natrinema limicola JCM 13563]
MSQTDASGSAEAALSDEEVAELVATLNENADELQELLELLSVLQETAADLAPEMRTAVRENREPLRDVRMAFEREETLVLFQQLGEHSEDLTELLGLLDATEGLASDLAPELRLAVRENRDVLRRLRMAVENEDMLVLIERLGENADVLAETLDLLDATEGLVEDLIPELQDASGDMRPAIRQSRLVAAGLVDATSDYDIDPYQLGQNLGNVMWFTQQVGDPQVLKTLDAGLGAFAEEEPKEMGVLGLLSALRDRNVRRGIGRIVEFLRRVGAR